MAGLVRGQEVRLAVTGRQLLHAGEAAFDLGPVLVAANIDQVDVDAGQAEDIRIAGVVQAEFGLALNDAFFEFPAEADPAVAVGAVVDEGKVGLDAAAARGHGDGDAGGGGAGEEVGMDGPADGTDGHLLIGFFGGCEGWNEEEADQADQREGRKAEEQTETGLRHDRNSLMSEELGYSFRCASLKVAENNPSGNGSQYSLCLLGHL